MGYSNVDGGVAGTYAVKEVYRYQGGEEVQTVDELFKAFFNSHRSNNTIRQNPNLNQKRKRLLSYISVQRTPRLEVLCQEGVR